MWFWRIRDHATSFGGIRLLADRRRFLDTISEMSPKGCSTVSCDSWACPERSSTRDDHVAVGLYGATKVTIRVGRLFLAAALSNQQDYGFHFIDGRKWPPVLTDVRGKTAVFGRGFVISALGVMFWATLDLHERLI